MGSKTLEDQSDDSPCILPPSQEMVYGIKFYGVYHPDGILARRCCCDPYPGMGFNAVVIEFTITNQLLFCVDQC